MIEFRIEPNPVPIVGLRGPIPAVRIQGYSRGQVVAAVGQREPSNYSVIGVSANVSIGGVSVPFAIVESTFYYGNPVANGLNQAFSCLIQLPPYLLDAIERERVHDVQISVSVELRHHSNDGAPDRMFQSSQGYMQINVSQKQWLDALAAMGYSGGWVIEVERPETEGWDQVVHFLEKAAERITARDPEGAVAQCRAAWNRLDPLIDAMWGEVATEVDRGSAHEEGFPPKSERVKKMRDTVRSWSNTGAHPESYAASMDDALLAYRQTASLVSFLSRKTVQAESHAAATERTRGA